MTDLEKKEFAESTRKYVIQFLINLEKYLLEEGPDESFNGFLCSYGYAWSDFIMDIIVPTGVFSEPELKILTEIENYFDQLLAEHIGINSWNNLRKDEYLKIKGLSYDYLTLVHDLNDY